MFTIPASSHSQDLLLSVEKCSMPTKSGICCDVTATFTMGGAPDHSSVDSICLYDAASKKEVCNANGNSGIQCLVNSQPCKFTPEYVRNVEPCIYFRGRNFRDFRVFCLLCESFCRGIF